MAASGYDAIKIVAGLLRDHELSRESLREALAGGFIFNGSLGNLTLPAGEHNMAFGLFRARIDDGRLVYI
jgi:ABC-type branched-subunit amino acid transport system substrate-binding protein